MRKMLYSLFSHSIWVISTIADLLKSMLKNTPYGAKTDTFIQQKLLNIIYRGVKSSTEDNDQNTS